MKTFSQKILYALLIAGMLAGCGGGGGGAHYPPPPASSLSYYNGGVLNALPGEGTPVDFNGRLIVVMGPRVNVAAPRIHIVDFYDASTLADFEAPEGITLICAFVEAGRLYIFGVSDFNMAQGLAAKGNRIVMTSTADMLTWDAAQTVYTLPPDTAAYNLSVTRAPGGYVMGYDFGGPGYDPSWQIAFLASPDLAHWTPTPGHYTAQPWTSANTLRYLDGYYYLFYSTQDSGEKYYTAAARSVDLASWELSSVAAIYPTQAYQNVNTTDYDFTECGTQVCAAFAVGDQSGNGAMATAVYAGSFADMAAELFPTP